MVKGPSGRGGDRAGDAVASGTQTATDGANYTRTVVSNGSVPDGDVSHLVVYGHPTGPFTLGGNVSGLGSIGPYPSVVVMLEGDPANTRSLQLVGNGAYSLGSVPGGTLYFVSMDTTGTPYDCVVDNCSGAARGHVTNMAITCHRR